MFIFLGGVGLVLIDVVLWLLRYTSFIFIVGVDVERLRKSGKVTGDAYLARLKRLRGDLADNEAAFKAAGFPIKVETFQCPNCGGTLELGMDKCEYCGQVLLS